MADIMYHNINEKKKIYFSEILCFTQRIKRLLHEKIKVYER